MRFFALALFAVVVCFAQITTYPPASGGGGSLPTGSGNCVVASPANGSSATVACRALVGADIPTLLTLGTAGAMAGTVGLRIAGDGAFAGGVNASTSQLWLDADSAAAGYHLVLSSRVAGVSHFTGIYAGDDGSFEIDADSGNGGLTYHIADGSWEFWGTGSQGGTVVTPSVTTTALTVATLPAAPVAGQRAFVTDSNAASFTLGIGAVVAAGGSTKVPVVYDGAAWRIG